VPNPKRQNPRVIPSQKSVLAGVLDEFKAPKSVLDRSNVTREVEVLENKDRGKVCVTQ